jgi:hypothetical protein
MAPKANGRLPVNGAEVFDAHELPTVPSSDGDAGAHDAWPDRLTTTRNSGVDFYYEQYRRLLVREESLLKQRDALRRENAALRFRLSGSGSVPARQIEIGRPRRSRELKFPAAVSASLAPALARVDGPAWPSLAAS